jgi:hypothetical protein
MFFDYMSRTKQRKREWRRRLKEIGLRSDEKWLAPDEAQLHRAALIGRQF